MTATHEELMAWTVSNACFSADTVSIGFEGTPAQKTRAVVTRALEALEANGIIEIKPNEDWPTMYVPDPPYKLPEMFGKG